jgi:hypothetical protein
MRRLAGLAGALLLLSVSGCLRPLTDRLDRLSQQIDGLNQQVIITNQKLDESNVRLKKMAGD